MDLLKIVNLIPYTYLNPITLIAYLGMSSHFQAIGIRTTLVVPQTVASNTNRYYLPSYLLVATTLTALFILIKVITLTALAKDNLQTSELVFVQPTLIWWILYGVTFVILGACFSSRGVEGNVMGFIFFPPLLIGSAVLLAMHFHWIWTEVL